MCLCMCTIVLPVINMQYYVIIEEVSSALYSDLFATMMFVLVKFHVKLCSLPLYICTIYCNLMYVFLQLTNWSGGKLHPLL